MILEGDTEGTTKEIFTRACLTKWNEKPEFREDLFGVTILNIFNFDYKVWYKGDIPKSNSSG